MAAIKNRATVASLFEVYQGTGKKNVNTLYSLSINGVEVCRIEFQAPRGLPIRPRINRLWLRAVVAGALADYYKDRRRVVTA